jgi:hypothetical protein
MTGNGVNEMKRFKVVGRAEWFVEREEGVTEEAQDVEKYVHCDSWREAKVLALMSVHKDAHWINDPVVSDLTLADLERVELERWNKGLKLDSLALSVERGYLLSK